MGPPFPLPASNLGPTHLVPVAPHIRGYKGPARCPALQRAGRPAGGPKPGEGKAPVLQRKEVTTKCRRIWHATIIPLRTDPLSSELGSQPELGCISTGERDHLGTRSVVVFCNPCPACHVGPAFQPCQLASSTVHGRRAVGGAEHGSRPCRQQLRPAAYMIIFLLHYMIIQYI